MDDEDMGYAIFFAYVLAHSASAFQNDRKGTLSSKAKGQTSIVSLLSQNQQNLNVISLLQQEV